MDNYSISIIAEEIVEKANQIIEKHKLIKYGDGSRSSEDTLITK